MSSTTAGSVAGVVIMSLEGAEFEHAQRFTFEASNNEAEYEAMIAGIELAAADDRARVLRLFTDSLLITNQIKGEYEVREPSMVKYLEQVKKILAELRSYEKVQIPRSKNNRADALSKLASSSLQDVCQSVWVDVLTTKSIEPGPTPIGVVEPKVRLG
ncbi:uncharacterized protein LOC141631697 [Silene latifolia]|uniref:uncharacterized protein LOC141631697 n=1 Tax=Silene latifolia TaxID=37657 RepID=UPI003D76BC83